MKLKELRIKNKLSQQEVARYLNIGQTTYSHYETERNEPNIEVLIKLSNLYHTTIDEIVGYKPKNIDSRRLELYNNIIKLEEDVIENLSKCIEGFVIAQELKERFTKEEK